MHEDTEIDPIVPELPTTRRTLPDGGRRDRTTSRPARPDCTPEDEGRESIEPMVPDFR